MFFFQDGLIIWEVFYNNNFNEEYIILAIQNSVPAEQMNH